MKLVNIFLANLTSGLLQCILYILDFLWFDIFDAKRIQNVTSFLDFLGALSFYGFEILPSVSFRLYFKYSVSQKWKDWRMTNTWDTRFNSFKMEAVII